MNKLLIFLLLIAVSLFASLGSGSNAEARKDQSAPVNLTATPTPELSIAIRSVELSRDEVIVPCPPPKSGIKREGSLCDEDMLVSIETKTNNPQNVEIFYYYTVTGGRIIGNGKSVTWDLTGVREGDYIITIGIGDGKKFSDDTVTKTIKVQNCTCCLLPCVCPTLVVTGGGGIKAGETVKFTADISGNFPDVKYNWTVSQGEIIEGQGTAEITVKTASLMNGVIKATVEISGIDDFCDTCPRTASERATIIK